MDKSRYEFENIETITSTFTKQAEDTNNLMNQVKTNIDSVGDGTGGIWTGEGAQRFMEVMQSEFMPKMGNLGSSLSSQSEKFKTISSILSEVNDTLTKHSEAIANMDETGGDAGGGVLGMLEKALDPKTGIKIAEASIKVATAPLKEVGKLFKSIF